MPHPGNQNFVGNSFAQTLPPTQNSCFPRTNNSINDKNDNIQDIDYYHNVDVDDNHVYSVEGETEEKIKTKRRRKRRNRNQQQHRQTERNASNNTNTML